MSFGGDHRFESTLMSLTEYGEEEARALDPFERTQTEARRLLASDEFRESYPGVFKPWANVNDCSGPTMPRRS